MYLRWLEESDYDSDIDDEEASTIGGDDILVPMIMGTLILLFILCVCTCFAFFIRWVINADFYRDHKRRRVHTDDHEEQKENVLHNDDNGEIRIYGRGSNRSNEPYEYYVVMRPVNGDQRQERTVGRLENSGRSGPPMQPLQNCFMEPSPQVARPQRPTDKSNTVTPFSEADYDAQLQRLINETYGEQGERSQSRMRQQRTDFISTSHNNRTNNRGARETNRPEPSRRQNDNYVYDEMDQVLSDQRLYNEILMPPAQNQSHRSRRRSNENVSSFALEHGNVNRANSSFDRENHPLSPEAQARAERKAKKKEKKISKVLKYTEKGHFDENFAEFEDKECPICFEQYDKECDIRKLIKCGHMFHSECIENWISSAIKHPTCPLCKIDIR